MNAIVKTWRNRLPVIADDLTHWSDIFTWRQHHYQFIVGHYDSQHQTTQKQDPTMKLSMVGVHASAQVRFFIFSPHFWILLPLFTHVEKYGK